MAVARCRIALDRAAVTASSQAKGSYKRWRADKAEEIAGAATGGDWIPLWALVRKVTKQKAGLRAAPVLHDAACRVAGTKEEIAELWAETFRKDFGPTASRQDAAGIEAEVRSFRTARPQQQEQRYSSQQQQQPQQQQHQDSPGREEWVALVADALAATNEDKAMGRDELPLAALRAGGLAVAGLLADVCTAAAADGIPAAWRGGRMVAVPRKAGAPLSLATVRGVQCSNAAPRVVGKVLRRQLRDALVAQVGDLQSGAAPAMGTEIATFTLKLFMANARVRAVSAGAVFADLKSAFYSAWPELAVGPLLSGEQRQQQPS